VKSPIVSLLVAASLLSACADRQPVTVAHHRKHVSPPAVEPPSFPAGSFNEKDAAVALGAGAESLKKGNLAAARKSTEDALALWPVATEGWGQLSDICNQQNDVDCKHYADFYLAKLVLLEGLPMRTAALGFETVAGNQVGTKADNFVYDQRTLDMANRLWAFCSSDDPANSKAPEPTEATFNEAYPYAPALLVIGIGAGLLAGIKSVATK
jgi:hypothetical protein